MSSYPIIFGGGLDPDASQYFQRAGVTDSTAKTQINNFIIGTKSLGLWNSMVCWPLRSSQNAGTGSTAYSLGGFGTYNGTLTNGPTWGSDGLTVGGGTESSLTVSPIVNGGTSGAWITAFKYASLVAGQGFESHTNFGHVGGGTYCPFADNQFYMDWAASRLSVASGTSANVPYFMHGDVGSGTQRIYRNGTQLASQATATNNTNTFGEVVIGYPGNSGICPFALFSNTSLASASSSIYSLYKSTLGVGLGLP
jgi:hypothetical protein